jgi:Protein of unknown function (DUF1153)
MQTSTRRRGVRVVIGPDGYPLSVADLPAPQAGKRWVTRRKAQVVAAVSGGLLTIREACERYMITLDEFVSWHGSVARFGTEGLRTTKLQHYRSYSSLL